MLKAVPPDVADVNKNVFFFPVLNRSCTDAVLLVAEARYKRLIRLANITAP